MNEAQKDFNSLHKAGFNSIHIAIAGALGVCAVVANFYPQIIFFMAVAAAAAWVAWSAAEKKREAREAAARAASYANICGPVLITSEHPNETVEDVQARAQAFREELRRSGNPYASQIPIVVYPYQPMLYGPGQLTAAWNIYQRMAGEQLHRENITWSETTCPAPLKPIFLSQVMPQPAQNEGAI